MVRVLRPSPLGRQHPHPLGVPPRLWEGLCGAGKGRGPRGRGWRRRRSQILFPMRRFLLSTHCLEPALTPGAAGGSCPVLDLPHGAEAVHSAGPLGHHEPSRAIWPLSAPIPNAGCEVSKHPSGREVLTLLLPLPLTPSLLCARFWYCGVYEQPHQRATIPCPI